MRFLLIAAALFSLSACTKVAFKIDDKINAMKANVLNATPTDGDGHQITNGGPGRSGGSGAGGTNGGGGTTTGGGPAGEGDGSGVAGITPGNIPVSRFCSDRRTNGITVMDADSLVATVSLSSGEVKCTLSNTSALKTALQAGSLPTASCNLADGKYVVSIIANGTVELVQNSSATKSAFSEEITIAGGKLSGNVPSVIVDSNPSADFNSAPYYGTTCDGKGSPLYIDFRKDASDFDILSAPNEGVMFDILGANGTPAYSKNQISWFEKGKFALLALPNKKGEVNDIDQLFGNNTLGKDGNFALNGFDALAKYDSNHDGVIDRFDEVFSKLRLWFDADRNGKADKHELRTLSDMGVVAIDLGYDRSFSESDKYGNEVKFKSVVKFKDGKLKSIFDVWFKL